MNISFSSLPVAQTPANSGDNSVLYALAGLILGAVAVAIIQRLLGQDAKSQAKRLLEQAQLEADNLAKKSELQQKEKLLSLQNQFESDLKKQRDEIRDRETQIASREQTLKQASDDLKKQEKFVESNQRKLADKLDDVSKKSDQYSKLITQVQADLQRVTGLSKEEAKRQLIELLEKE
ncbi:MAG: Rnase Y domain-containing protein, partial [Pirellula sp.]